ncbi:MAG: hypothetical protein ACKVOK_02370 [Flavobacteriales bacterium]
MKLKLFFCLTLAFAILFSCKKEEAVYKLSGRAIDGRSGNPVSGVNASVEKQVVSGGAFGATFTQAASTSTDGFGMYSLEWPRENFAALKLKASKTNYITTEKDLLVSEFEGGNLVEEDITIFPESFITVKIQNTGENYPEDVINFTFTNAYFDCICCANGFKVFEGANVDTQYTCKLYGDTWLKFQKQIYSLEADTIANDSIWCPAFQTTELLIQY